MFELDIIERDSVILNTTQKQQVSEMIGIPFSGLKNCYRMSQHGGVPQVFHKKCGFRGPTVTVVKSQYGTIYGGYASKSWDDSLSGAYVADSNAFIFSLVNNRGKSLKLNTTLNTNHLRMGSLYGPTFGAEITFTLLGTTFEHGSQTAPMGTTYADTMPASNLIFTGSAGTVFTELEVYSLVAYVDLFLLTVSRSNQTLLNSSEIVNQTQRVALENWTGYNASMWYLCYRATDHGIAASLFHARCDNKGATIVLYKNAANYIFGYKINRLLLTILQWIRICAIYKLWPSQR